MFDNINIDASAPRASVEYAKARAAIDLQAKSRIQRRNARMAVVSVLHGMLESKEGKTIVVFPDQSEARF